MSGKSAQDNGRRSARRWISALASALELDEYKFPPFESWKELQKAREDVGLERVDQENNDLSINLNISLACLEIVHLYASNIALAAFMRLYIRKQITPKTQATFTIFSGIAADIGAINALCRNGYDIQAKTILRSLREKVDCAIAVQLDRSFAVGYVKADGSEEVNRFWHKRISRGKLKRNIARRLTHYSNSGEAPLDKSWFARRESFERWLGEAVHPSHTTGLLSAFPTFGDQTGPDGNMGWFGRPSDMSVPTIRAVLALSFELYLLVRWRDLINEDYMTTDGNTDEPSLYQMHLSLEKFLNLCFANTFFSPNLDLWKILLYLDGYAIMPVDSTINFVEYDREIAGLLVALLKKAEERLNDKLSEMDAKGAEE